jgi:hypothetical protein
VILLGVRFEGLRWAVRDQLNYVGHRNEQAAPGAGFGAWPFLLPASFECDKIVKMNMN